ncbi:MAG: DUF1929 domain-containing protein [Candidatus Kapabacteria bacterium]|nr:DUF1929 domain-containing protein [Candidatus Kapabacteria bacterium]
MADPMHNGGTDDTSDANEKSDKQSTNEKDKILNTTDGFNNLETQFGDKEENLLQHGFTIIPPESPQSTILQNNLTELPDADKQYSIEKPGPPVILAKQPEVVAKICCVGFNPETSILSAIVEIDVKSALAQPWQCERGLVAHVGFWLQEPTAIERPFFFTAGTPWNNAVIGGSDFRFIGNASVHIPYEQKQIPNIPLNYSLQLELTPDMALEILRCNEEWRLPWPYLNRIPKRRLPLLRCILKIETENYIDPPKSNEELTYNLNNNINNYINNGLKEEDVNNIFVSVSEAYIQFPRRSYWGKWEFFEKKPFKNEIPGKTDPNANPTHLVQLPNKKILLFSGMRVGYDRIDPSAALYDVDSGTFQSVPHPLTEFYAWGYVNVPNFKDAVQVLDSQYVIIKGSTLWDDVNPLRVVKTSAISHDGNKFIVKDPIKYEELVDKTLARVHDIFCSCHNMLPDGTLFVIGGQETIQTVQGHDEGDIHEHHDRGLRQVSIFDPKINNWQTLAPSMKNGRWYASSIILSDGRVFIMDGHPDSAYQGSHSNIDLEIFDWRVRQWTYERSNNASYGVDDRGTGDPESNDKLGFYPRLALLPDGCVFCYNKINLYNNSNANDVVNNYCKWNPQTKLWTKVTDGADNLGPAVRQYYTGALLPLRYSMASSDNQPIYKQEQATCFIVTKTLKDEGPGVSNQAFFISPLSDNNNNKKWRIRQSFFDVDGRPKGRRHGNCVILADGTVMLVGGVKDALFGLPKDRDNEELYPNLDVDIYDPWLDNINDATCTPGSWFKGAPSLKRRGYHSSAILLHDGRVMLGGTDYDNSIEIYTPDYLWRGPRPVFSVTPDNISYDQFLHIKLGKGWKYKHLHPEKFALLRCYSVTHAFGLDQRYVNLYACRTEQNLSKEQEWKIGKIAPPPDPDDTSFRLWIPPQHYNVLPPGYYTLFMVSKLSNGYSGSPSLGQIIKIA